jgi:hypothetical protein
VAVPPNQPDVERRITLTIDAVKAGQLFEVFDYLDLQHYHIDPDMYRLDRERIEQLREIFTPGDPPVPVTMSFTYRELFNLSIMIEAADTYSHRKNQPRVYGVTDEQLAALDQWCVVEMRAFRESLLPGTEGQGGRSSEPPR